MSDFAYTAALIGGVVLVAMLIRAAQWWLAGAPRRSRGRGGHRGDRWPDVR